MKRVIFICNSETDGFNEGDGDLMDKLTMQINCSGKAEAVRVVMYEKDVPNDKKSQIEKNIMCMENKIPTDIQQKYNVRTYQQKFLELISKKQYDGCEKVVYIGSRLDWDKMPNTFTDCGSLKKGGLEKVFDSLDIKNMSNIGQVNKAWHYLRKKKTDLIIPGSDKVDGSYETLILKQSGALFDGVFIKKLKEKGIKITICCLEYKFFFRSKNSLRSAFEMLRQQLFLADSIHFLTKEDEVFFKLTLDNLKINKTLIPMDVDVEKFVFSSTNEHQNAKLALTLTDQENDSFNFDFTQFSNQLHDDNWIKETKSKIFYSPGIYTIQPIKVEQTLEIFAKNKKNNILQFGMIRSQKGVDEAVLMSTALMKCGYGLYIIGRIRNLSVLYSLLQKCFICDKDIEDPVKDNVKLIIEKKEIQTKNELDNIKKILPTEIPGKKNLIFVFIQEKNQCIILWRQEEKIEELVLNENNPFHRNILSLAKDFKTNKDKLEKMLYSNNKEIAFKRVHMVIKSKKISLLKEGIQVILDNMEIPSKEELKKMVSKEGISIFSTKLKTLLGMSGLNDFASRIVKYCDANLKKIKDIKIFINLSEEEVVNLSKDCRFSIKLDHKGMAENASSIAACLGLYLPVFTTYGYLTSKEFLPEGKFAQAIIAPNKTYHFHDEGEITEIRPQISSQEFICTVLEKETPDSYLERIQVLHNLYESNFFSCKRLTDELLENFNSLFIMSKEKTFMMEHKK